MISDIRKFLERRRARRKNPKRLALDNMAWTGPDAGIRAFNEDTCVCCGAYVPEGSMVCINCATATR